MRDTKSIVRHGYDLVSHAYRSDNAGDGDYAPWLDELERRVVPGSRILDLGCGCGVPVAKRLAQRYEVTGVDISPVQIQRARHLVPSADFMCADMTTVAFGAESFAAITCLYALFHLPINEQKVVLANVHSWLRPGGLFLCIVGHGAWTGVETDWLGVAGGDMWWSHADTATYRQWFVETGLKIESETFVPEGRGGHALLLATR